MLIRVEKRLKRKKSKHGKRMRPFDSLKRTKTYLILECDQCKLCFERPGTNLSKRYHFCSMTCKSIAQKLGGVLNRPCAFARPDVIESLKKRSHTKIAEKRRSESLRKYHQNRPDNWENPGNSVEACKKRHETMKKNGSYGKSKIEDLMYQDLIMKFGFEDVERNVLMNNCWPIDFYVKSIDTYVQLDGVYWHGLDRPIELISEHKTKRDVKIHKKWLTDREQDRWFSDRKIRLVRLTDIQFNSGIRL
jgi:hypothetical protein